MKHKRSQMIASHAQDPDFSAQPEENSPGRHRIRTYIRTAYQQDVTVAHPETASLLHCIGHTLSLTTVKERILIRNSAHLVAPHRMYTPTSR